MPKRRERYRHCNPSPVRGRNPDLNSGLFVPRASPLPRSQTDMLDWHPTKARYKLHARKLPMSAAGIATLSWRWRPGWCRRAVSMATVLYPRSLSSRCRDRHAIMALAPRMVSPSSQQGDSPLGENSIGPVEASPRYHGASAQDGVAGSIITRQHSKRRRRRVCRA